MILPDWRAPVAALCTTRGDLESDIPRTLGEPGILLPVIRQVHGADVVVADQVAGDCAADAIVSRSRELGCRIVTADCLPILLCNESGSEIAAIHAGWRGLAAGVIEATLAAMGSAPGELSAWIAPAISQRHYEVGADVFAALAVDTASAACFAARGEKYLADLPALGRLRLQRAGVIAVTGGDLCTYADTGRFHSWRRDGQAAGRQVSVICMRTPGHHSRT